MGVGLLVRRWWRSLVDQWHGLTPGQSRRMWDDEQRLLEEGRRLASQRDDLIARGVDPGDLEVPL